MKKVIFKTKNSIKNQKKLYLLLIGLAILSFILGGLFIFVLNDESSTYISNGIKDFFNNISEYSGISSFFNSFVNSSVYILIIWVLGISIIGIPIILIIYIFKFFLFGFSLSSIIYTYKLGGILRCLIHLFPHQLVFLLILLLVSFYGISFSIKLYKYLFFKKIINFKEYMNKYLKVLLYSLVVCVFISLYEAFISTYLLNLFNK